MRLETPDLVRELTAILGTRLVAFLAGVTDTRAVRAWAAGERRPRSAAEARLRFSHVVAELIARAEGDRVARAWLVGLNPELGDRAPARLIRDGVLDDVRPQVLAAAQAFAASP